jgi:hypothetical protein
MLAKDLDSRRVKKKRLAPNALKTAEQYARMMHLARRDYLLILLGGRKYKFRYF